MSDAEKIFSLEVLGYTERQRHVEVPRGLASFFTSSLWTPPWKAAPGLAWASLDSLVGFRERGWFILPASAPLQAGDKCISINSIPNHDGQKFVFFPFEILQPQSKLSTWIASRANALYAGEYAPYIFNGAAVASKWSCGHGRDANYKFCPVCAVFYRHITS